MRRTLIFLATFLLYAGLSFAQAGTDSLELRVYFPKGRCDIVPSFRNNDLQLTQFTRKMSRYLADTTICLQDVVIYTGASPEGNVKLNRQLSIDRGLYIKYYLTSALNLPDSVFVMKPMGEDWARLAEMVKRYRAPSWKQILQIIEDNPEDKNDPEGKALEERKRLIMQLDDGKVWEHLNDDIFPELRGGDNFVSCHFTPKISEPRTIVVENFTSIRDTVYIFSRDTIVTAPLPIVTAPVPQNLPSSEVGQKTQKRDTSKRKPYQFALKTNLLMDLATALNVELEFPIGQHWSVMAEQWFPWWTFWYDGYSYTLQILQTSVEGRYWFGNCSKRPVLSGFFLGAYAGAAYFDTEWRSEGIQGEAFINAGLSFGYGFNIGRNWRFETSLSAGYLQFDGRTYHHDDYWGLRVWQQDRTVSWIGPTKLKCSICWLIPPHRQKSKKEKSR